MRRYKVPEEYREYGEFAYCTSPLVRWSRHRHLIALSLSGENRLGSVLNEPDGKFFEFIQLMAIVFLTVDSYHRSWTIFFAMVLAFNMLLKNSTYRANNLAFNRGDRTWFGVHKISKEARIGIFNELRSAGLTGRDFCAISWAPVGLRSRWDDFIAGFLIPIVGAMSISTIVAPGISGFGAIPIMSILLASIIILHIGTMDFVRSGGVAVLMQTAIERERRSDFEYLFAAPPLVLILFFGLIVAIRLSLYQFQEDTLLLGFAVGLGLAAFFCVLFRRLIRAIIRSWVCIKMRDRFDSAELHIRLQYEGETDKAKHLDDGI